MRLWRACARFGVACGFAAAALPWFLCLAASATFTAYAPHYRPMMAVLGLLPLPFCATMAALLSRAVLAWAGGRTPSGWQAALLGALIGAAAGWATLLPLFPLIDKLAGYAKPTSTNGAEYIEAVLGAVAGAVAFASEMKRLRSVSLDPKP